MSSQQSHTRSNEPPFTNLVLVPQKRWIPKSTSDDADTLHPFAPIPFLCIHPQTGKVVGAGVPLAYVASKGENANLGNLIVSAGERVFKDAYRAYLRVLVRTSSLLYTDYILITLLSLVAWLRTHRIRDFYSAHDRRRSYQSWTSCPVHCQDHAAVLCRTSKRTQCQPHSPLNALCSPEIAACPVPSDSESLGGCSGWQVACGGPGARGLASCSREYLPA